MLDCGVFLGLVSLAMDSNNTSPVASPVVPRAVGPDNETPSFDNRTVEQRDAQAKEIMTLSRQVLEDPTQPADYKAGVAQNLEVLQAVRSLTEGASEDSGDESDGSELCFHIFCDDGCRGECLKDKPAEDSTLSAKQMEIDSSDDSGNDSDGYGFGLFNSPELVRRNMSAEDASSSSSGSVSSDDSGNEPAEESTLSAEQIKINQQWKRFSINELNENFRYLRMLIDKICEFNVSHSESERKDLASSYKDLENLVSSDILGRLEVLETEITALRPENVEQEELHQAGDGLEKAIGRFEGRLLARINLLRNGHPPEEELAKLDALVKLIKNSDYSDSSGSDSDGSDDSGSDSDGYGFGLFDFSELVRRNVPAEDVSSSSSGSVSSDDSDGELSDDSQRALEGWEVLHVGANQQLSDLILLSPSERFAFRQGAPVTRDVVRPQVSEEKSLLGAFGQMLCHPPANLLLLIFLYFLVFQHVSESGEL